MRVNGGVRSSKAGGTTNVSVPGAHSCSPSVWSGQAWLWPPLWEWWEPGGPGTLLLLLLRFVNVPSINRCDIYASWHKPCIVFISPLHKRTLLQDLMCYCLHVIVRKVRTVKTIESTGWHWESTGNDTESWEQAGKQTIGAKICFEWLKGAFANMESVNPTPMAAYSPSLSPWPSRVKASKGTRHFVPTRLWPAFRRSWKWP